MKVQARFSSPDPTVEDLVAALDLVRDRPHASVRVDLDEYYVRRVTIHSSGTGRFSVSCTGMSKGVHTEDAELAARLAIASLQSMDDRGACAGHHYYRGIRNDAGFCRACWVKAGNDLSTWSPMGMSVEDWQRFGGREPRPSKGRAEGYRW